jgi:hypothetical protein
MEAPQGQQMPVPDMVMAHMADKVVWSRGRVAVRWTKKKTATE